MSFQLLERKWINNIDDLIGGNVLIQRSPTIFSLLKRIKDAGKETEGLFMNHLEEKEISIYVDNYCENAWFDNNLGQYLICNYDLILDKLGLLRSDEPLFDLIKTVKMAAEKYRSLYLLKQRLNKPFAYKYSGELGNWKYQYNEDDEEYDTRVFYKGNLILGIDYPYIKYVNAKLTESFQGRISAIIENAFEWNDNMLIHPSFFWPLDHDKGVDWCLDD